MSKITREQRIKIYEERKEGKTVSNISKKYHISKSGINYLVKLLDVHGVDILRQDKNRSYSPALRQEIIDMVILQKQSIVSTAIAYGLPSDGLLHAWIKAYKDNEYVIVKKRKGRPFAMKKEKPTKKYEEMSLEDKINDLENKNLDLEIENEYLKKLRTIIQHRKKQEQKKK